MSAHVRVRGNKMSDHVKVKGIRWPPNLGEQGKLSTLSG